MQPIFSNIPSLNVFLGLLMVGLGAAALGSQAPYFAYAGAYADYASIVQTVTGKTAPIIEVQVMIAGSAIVLAAGVGMLVAAATMLSSTASLQGKRVAFIVFLVLAALGGIVQLAGGLALQSSPFHTIIDGDTAIFNEARPNETLSGDREVMAQFGMALFEECCVPNNWISQNMFGNCTDPCPGVNPPDPGFLVDTRIYIVSDFFDTSDLCTCVRPEEKANYAAMKSRITTDMCTKLNAIRVVADANLIIPTTCERPLGCLSVKFIMDKVFPGKKVTVAPLIGNQLFTDGSTVAFGCGLGYPKGVMWYQQVFDEQVILPAATRGITLGALAIAAAVFALLLGWFFAREDKDMGDQAGWENTVAAKWNDPAFDQSLAVKATPNMVSSADGPAAAAVASKTVAPTTGGSANLNERLYRFYDVYDRTKSKEEIDAIAKYGKNQGEAALNKKLREKYNADLTTPIEGGPPI